MNPLEAMALYRALHDEELRRAERDRQVREQRAHQPPRRPQRPLPQHQLTVRHLWWHGAVERLHRLWSPRPTASAQHRKSVRNVG